jgi:hypothetical protein
MWVRLRVSDQAGNPIFDSSALVRPDKFQPNGPSCAPFVYQDRVVATRTKGLVPQPLRCRTRRGAAKSLKEARSISR